jgi:beta-lactamase regulating signal transducer with metallopeptidase domain
MTNFLLDCLLSVSIMLAILLACRFFILRYLGPKLCYQLWLLVPISTVLCAIPNSQILSIEVNKSNVFLVSQTLGSEIASTNYSHWLSLVWIIGACVTLTVFLIRHYQHMCTVKLDEKLNTQVNASMSVLPVYLNPQPFPHPGHILFI